jgi:hypothetical protein
VADGCSAGARTYVRRDPAACPVNGVVRSHLETLLCRAEDAGRHVPRFVQRELKAFTRCGVLAHGFVRVRCKACRHDRLVAFSCKGRGLCPSCGGRRMAETAAHLVDRVLPQVGVRQWVLSFPWELRRKLGYEPQLLSEVLTVVMRAVFGQIRERVREQVGPVDARDIHAGGVTFIQRFGDALNLNPHFHSLVLDGAYVTWGGLRFVPLPPPSTEQVARLAKRIRDRVLRLLRHRGVLDESGNLVTEEDDDGSVLQVLSAASVQGVAAMGPDAGKKLTRLGARVRPEARWEETTGTSPTRCVAVGGFSLHANVAVHGNDRKGLEHMCRYVARPPVARERLSVLPSGQVYYRFKNPWRDGSKGIVMDGVEFVGRVAALIPRPQVNLVRYHGCLAPASKIRGSVVRDRSQPAPKQEGPSERAGLLGVLGRIRTVHRQVMPLRSRNYGWSELMKRVFVLDVLECPRCSGPMEAIAQIEDPVIARKILEHLGLPAVELACAPARGPPELGEAEDEPPLLDDEWM